MHSAAVIAVAVADFTAAAVDFTAAVVAFTELSVVAVAVFVAVTPLEAEVVLEAVPARFVAL
jgi:hypothetical protein